MLVSLNEAKEYLKVEYEDEDTLLVSIINSAEKLCSDILRRELDGDEAVRIAVLYAIGVLYENRGTKEEVADLVPTLKRLLSGSRKEAF